MGKWVARVLLRAVLTTAALAGGYMLVSSLAADGVAQLAPPEPEAPAPVTASPAERVAWLVQRHGCWTGAAPPDMAGRTPGHVVVSVDGEVRYSAKLVDAALESVFGTPRRDLVVHAFCR
jgi:hypothetical protein